MVVRAALGILSDLQILGSHSDRNACHEVFSSTIQDRLILIRKEICSTVKCKWTPHLFLNKGDLINRGYINQIIDREALGDAGFWARMHKWVAPHTLLSLITLNTYPMHLLPSADFTIAGSYCNPFQSHALKQWYEDPKWKSGNEVGRLKFGRQLSQRIYNMRREYITVGKSDVKVMAYCQTKTSTFVQATVSTMTSKQKQVIFLFNTEQDAETAQQLWPQELRNWDINDCIAQGRSFEFRFRKFKKGAVTFYIYAVRSGQVPFQRELEWRALLREFEVMKDVTNLD